MIQGLSQVFHRYKKALVACMIIGLLSIPIMDIFVLQRDRNRNLAYGTLFWEHGFNVYTFNDGYLRSEFGVSEENLLQEEIVNVTYEYPPAVLLFFAGIAKAPLPEYHQKLLANVILFIIANFNLLLLLKIGEKYQKKNWFRIFAGVYYFAEVLMAIGGGKMSPLTNLFMLVAIYHYKKEDWVKANVFLAFAVQVKIYPIVLLPFFLIKSRKKIIWFLTAISPLGLFWLFENSMGDSFIRHVSNQTSYSPYHINPLYIGHVITNIISLVTLLVFFLFFLKKVKQLKSKESMMLLGMLPVFFFVGWVLPWYFVWLLPMTIILENPEDMKKYLGLLFLLFLLYCLGLCLNMDYYQSNNLWGMMTDHFNSTSVINELNNSMAGLSGRIKTLGAGD